MSAKQFTSQLKQRKDPQPKKCVTSTSEEPTSEEPTSEKPTLEEPRTTH